MFKFLGLSQRWSRGHKARGQGQGHQKISRPRPRTDPLEAKAKDQGHRRKCSPKKVLKIFFRRSQKKAFQKFFSGEKGLLNFFFRRSLHEETKKKVFGDFPQGFWRFLTKFQLFKNSAVFEPRTEQFSRT